MSVASSLAQPAQSEKTFPRVSVRFTEENPNHHMWNNNGTWFLHYTVHTAPQIKTRVRSSLETKDIEVARLRRDEALTKVGVVLG